jgi:hypothetical protein
MTGIIRVLATLLLVTASICLTGATIAQELEKPLDAVIEFSERGFDFGFMPSGAQAMHTYIIENKGTDTLRIIRVSPTCGCTSAPLSRPDIEPEGTSRLEMYFNGKKFTGQVNKEISILSNASNDPYTTIYFSARVGKEHPFVSAEPDIIEPGRNNRAKVGSSYMTTITNQGPDTLGIKIVSCSEPYIEAKLAKETIDPGRSVDLMVKVMEFCERYEDPWLSVTLETSDPQQYRLTIPVHVPR